MMTASQRKFVGCLACWAIIAAAGAVAAEKSSPADPTVWHDGKQLGIAWKMPYRVEVTNALKPGDNVLGDIRTGKVDQELLKNLRWHISGLRG